MICLVSRLITLALVLTVWSSPGLADTYLIGLSTPPFTTLLSSDFVVRGIVRDARAEVVPAGKYDLSLPPGMQLDGRFVHINRATLEIKSVLKGSCNVPRIDVVAGDQQSLGWLEGKEIIFAATLDENLMGGSYRYSRSGTFVRTENGWLHESGMHDESEVLGAIDSVRVENLASDADIVASAVVDTVEEYFRKSDSKETATFQEWMIHLVDVCKGVGVPDAVRVQLIRKGFYWPAWRAPLPRDIQPGDSLYVFLKRDEGVYHVLGGVNGCLKITSRGLIYNDHVLLDSSLAEMNQRVRASVTKPQR